MLSRFLLAKKLVWRGVAVVVCAWRHRRENCEFEINLDFTVRLSL